ncbi:unnamed protein product [Rotaria socialis]|uniref:Uncharacterized protein n=1 Tax=Rotaria socialis TaxID=392032 RepID=A0A818VNL2_9BILA|nr:unnamed protein product [Rotaria socialis]CAF4449748.1 unnamed protein product [Rotaria socialis]
MSDTKKPGKPITFVENNLNDDNIEELMKNILSLPELSDERYHIMNRKVHGIEFLRRIREINKFCKHATNSEEALQQIKDFLLHDGSAREITATAVFNDGPYYTLTMILIPENQLLHVYITALQVNLCSHMK